MICAVRMTTPYSAICTAVPNTASAHTGPHCNPAKASPVQATPEQMAELEKSLKARNVTYQLEWHPGALHGFMMPSRAEIYNETAAEKVWGRMEALFARTLK